MNPHQKNIWTMPIQFIFFFKKKYPEFFEQFLNIEQDYYHTHHPELLRQEPKWADAISQNRPQSLFQKPKKYLVNKSWVEALAVLNEDWFRSARRLNKARNAAAHFYDVNRIQKAFGVSGPNAAGLVKQECVQMLHFLLGIAHKTGIEDRNEST